MVIWDTFRFSELNTSFSEAGTFRFADYTKLNIKDNGE